jgi:hypothetical protein
MLDFLFHKSNKREEVRRVLHGRVNRAHSQAVSVASLRGATRGSFTEVVWVVPCDSPATANFSKVFPAVTKDLSTSGLSILHTATITDPCLIIGLKDLQDRRFLACTRKHCTALGCGFYLIGMLADEVLEVRQGDLDTMTQAIAKREVPGQTSGASNARPVAARA